MPPSARSRRLSAPTAARWARVRLFAMDVDGVLTDGTVHISSDGSESKAFSILDGHGLRRLTRAGIAVAWISGRASGATSARAKELAIPHVIQGPVEKLDSLRTLAARLGLGAAECAYMGDDEIDVAALRWAGLACFGILVLRLYAVDLADAPMLVRIGLLFASGMVLVGTGVAYARITRRSA